jgi:hypothetical protein
MSLLSVILIFLTAYPWPMKNDGGNFNGPLTVYATLGDARGDDNPPIVNRFHHGIDIVAPNGTAVYSIDSGTAYTHESTGDNAHVQVGHYWYIHVKDDATRIRDEQPVTGILEDPLNPTKIAEVRDYGDPGVSHDHLHFQIGPPGAVYNPLSHYYNADGVLTDDSLNNYIDTLPPVVWKPTFWKAGCENIPGSRRRQLVDALWGKLEIRAKARDKQISYRGRDEEYTGIYSLQWILKPKGNSGVQYINNSFFFDQVQPPNNGNPVTLIYDTTVTRHANSETFHYWLTNPIINHEVEDRYFNTKLKQDEEWNGDVALINKEAAYKDGWYRVWALGHDIEGNGGDTVKRKGADFTDVLFDNYVPFVDEVTVKKDEEIKYNGKWELNGSEMELDIPTDDSVSIGDEINLTITFSEIMGSEIRVKLEKEENEIGVEGSWKEDKSSWEGNVTIPDEEESKGEWTIMTPHTANGLRLTAKV